MKNILPFSISIFLNFILIVNLFVMHQRRNLDIIGILVFTFLVFKIFNVVRHRSGFRRKRFQFLSRFFADSFYLLVLINITINITHLYSYGFEAKVYRSFEYLQTFFISLVILIPKLRFLKKNFISFTLLYAIIPPVSATLVMSYLFYSETIVIILSMQVWLIYQNFIKVRKVKNNCNYGICILPVLFLLFPAIGFFSNSWTINLLEFISGNLISILSALIIALSVKSKNEWGKILFLIIICFLGKILIIGLFPSPFPARGGVNNNLYAISYEFIFFTVLIYTFFLKTKYFKILNIIFLFFLLLNIYNLQSRSAFIAIGFTSFIFILLSSFKNKKFNAYKHYFAFAIISLILFMILSFYYIFYINTTASMEVRIKIWELAFRGWTSNFTSFVFGVGDYGKINFLQYVNFAEVEKIKLLHDLGSGFFQMHIHNEFLAFAYGSGILYLLFFIFLAFMPIYRLSNFFSEFSVYHGFGFVIIAYLIHGITEPIISSGLTSSLFWICYFLIITNINKKEEKKKFLNQSLFKIVNIFLIILLGYFSIGNVISRNLTQTFIHYPQIRQLIRSIEIPVNPVSLKKEKIELIIKSAEIKIKYFPVSIYEFVNLADLHLYNSTLTNSNESKERARELYCIAFEKLPIPSFYNNLRAIKEIKNIELKNVCGERKKLGEMIMDYDKFGLVPANFY